MLNSVFPLATCGDRRNFGSVLRQRINSFDNKAIERTVQKNGDRKKDNVILTKKEMPVQGENRKPKYGPHITDCPPQCTGTIFRTAVQAYPTYKCEKNNDNGSDLKNSQIEFFHVN
jgi:hypothetical protein